MGDLGAQEGKQETLWDSQRTADSLQAWGGGGQSWRCPPQGIRSSGGGGSEAGEAPAHRDQREALSHWGPNLVLHTLGTEGIITNPASLPPTPSSLTLSHPPQCKATGAKAGWRPRGGSQALSGAVAWVCRALWGWEGRCWVPWSTWGAGS